MEIHGFYLFCCLWLVTGGENSEETYWSKYILRYMKCQSPKGPPVPTDTSVESCPWLLVDGGFCLSRRSIGKSSTRNPPSAIDLWIVVRIFDLRRTASIRTLHKFMDLNNMPIETVCQKHKYLQVWNRFLPAIFEMIEGIWTRGKQYHICIILHHPVS